MPGLPVVSAGIPRGRAALETGWPALIGREARVLCVPSWGESYDFFLARTVIHITCDSQAGRLLCFPVRKNCGPSAHDRTQASPASLMEQTTFASLRIAQWPEQSVDRSRGTQTALSLLSRIAQLAAEWRSASRKFNHMCPNSGRWEALWGEKPVWRRVAQEASLTTIDVSLITSMAGMGPADFEEARA